MVLRKALAQRGQKILTLGLGRKEEKPAPGAAGSAPASGWSPGATRWQPPTTHVFPARFGGGGGVRHSGKLLGLGGNSVGFPSLRSGLTAVGLQTPCL